MTNNIRSVYKRDFRGYKKIPKRKKICFCRGKNNPKVRRSIYEDFHHKCAYCGYSIDKYDSSFEIDHLRASSKYCELDKVYSNYVLSCKICNSTKNADDVSIDPASYRFSQLFYRNKYGAIVPNKNLCKFGMNQSLKLIQQIGLYKEIYKLDYILESLGKILTIEMTKAKEEIDIDLLKRITAITDMINSEFQRKTSFIKPS